MQNEGVEKKNSSIVLVLGANVRGQASFPRIVSGRHLVQSRLVWSLEQDILYESLNDHGTKLKSR